MSGLYSERTARRRYRCERHLCEDWIEPGMRYVRASLPPWTGVNESPDWWTLRLHGRNWEDCPRNAALLAEVERGTGVVAVGDDRA